MKDRLYMESIDELLHSSAGMAAGFVGDDRRPVAEIVDADAAELARLGYSCRDVAERMRRILELALPGLGTWVKIGENAEAVATDTRGILPCPWPHAGVFPKTMVTVRLTDRNWTVSWSALNIHLIEEHGFFEGRGSPFRIEPKQLVELIRLFAPQSTELPDVFGAGGM